MKNKGDILPWETLGSNRTTVYPDYKIKLNNIYL